MGKDREEFMERVLVADVQALKAQTGAYSLMLNQSGGIIDDVIVSRVRFLFYYFYFSYFVYVFFFIYKLSEGEKQVTENE